MAFLSGLQAVLKSAADNRVCMVCGVPGSPVTEVISSFEESPDFSAATGWFVNEKIAFEWALGASFSGKRSLVVVKHVGMNVLADPLMTSMIHTIGAGLVILVGDDPEVAGSQNSQDSRYYGSLSRSPVFDPSAPQEIYDYLTQAFMLSEKMKAPTIVRVTAAVLHETADVSHHGVFDIPPDLKMDLSVWEYRMRGRYQRSHSVNDALAEQASADFCIIEKSRSSSPNPLGIIVSGFCYSRVQAVLKRIRNEKMELANADCSVLKVGVVSPLPLSRLRGFLEKHETVLVVEESEPFIEDQIRIFGRILGKRSGHLPFGNVTEAHILSAIEKSNLPAVPIPSSLDIYKRPDDASYFCAGCFYPHFYALLARLKEEIKVPVIGDIGCSMYGSVSPYFVLEAAVSLGTSIGIASGAARSVGKKSIAVIGDYGFFHSGLLSLTEAAEKSVPLLVFVMHNSVAAMTGGQKTYDPEKLIRAAVDTGDASFPKSVVSLRLDPSGAKEVFEEALQKLLKVSFEEARRPGLSIISIGWVCSRDVR